MSNRKQLASYIAQRLKNGQLTGLAKSVASYLVSARQTSELEALMRNVAGIRADQGKTELTITSARPLSQSTINQVKELGIGKNAIITTEIDESLVGGLVLQTHEHLLDLSLRHKLNQLRKGTKV